MSRARCRCCAPRGSGDRRRSRSIPARRASRRRPWMPGRASSTTCAGLPATRSWRRWRRGGRAGVVMHDVAPDGHGDLITSIVRESVAASGQRARRRDRLGAPDRRSRVRVRQGLARRILKLLRRLGELRVLGRPILAGTSRKSTIGRVLGLPEHDRVEGTAATVALAIAGGADIVRVHDVREMVRVARIVMRSSAACRSGAAGDAEGRNPPSQGQGPVPATVIAARPGSA